MKAKELAEILLKYPEFNVTTLGELYVDYFRDCQLSTHEVDVDENTIDIDVEVSTIFIGQLES